MEFISYIEVKNVWQQKDKEKADVEVYCCKVLVLY